MEPTTQELEQAVNLSNTLQSALVTIEKGAIKSVYWKDKPLIMIAQSRKIPDPRMQRWEIVNNEGIVVHVADSEGEALTSLKGLVNAFITNRNNQEENNPHD